MKRNHPSGPRCLRLVLAVALVIGGTATGASAFQAQITPSDDSYVEDSLPTTNFGTSVSMYVGDAPPNVPNSIARSYLKFDLSVLPVGAVIDTAIIHIYNNVIGYPNVTVGAHYLPNDGWTELTITWNNAPTGFNAVATALRTISLATWNTWNVTSDVQAVWAGDQVYSVVMKEPVADEGVAGNFVTFNTKEDPQPTDRPYLRVVYTLASPVEEATWAGIKAMFM